MSTSKVSASELFTPLEALYKYMFKYNTIDRIRKQTISDHL